MAAKITELIDKQDSIEIVRDELAAILALERDNQKLLAVAAGEDSALWDFDVYAERSSPWELLEDDDGKIIGQVPLVNVYIDNTSFDGSIGDNIFQHAYNLNINIDCLSAKSHRLESGNIQKGDKLAALDAQRIARLVRNILMSSAYARPPLGLAGILNTRMVQSLQMFQPQINDHPAQHCVGCRLVYSCSINEFSPQYDAPELELVSGQTTRGEDGKVLFNVEFDTTIET